LLWPCTSWMAARCILQQAHGCLQEALGACRKVCLLAGNPQQNGMGCRASGHHVASVQAQLCVCVPSVQAQLCVCVPDSPVCQLCMYMYTVSAGRNSNKLLGTCYAQLASHATCNWRQAVRLQHCVVVHAVIVGSCGAALPCTRVHDLVALALLLQFPLLLTSLAHL
jgi:hypothetical protein